MRRVGHGPVLDTRKALPTGELPPGIALRRAALVRVFGGGNGGKTDDTDAHSIALVGLNSTDLPVVRPDGTAVALRLLSNRRSELVALRTQAVCRIHRDLVTLIPGASSKRLTAKEAKAILA